MPDVAGAHHFSLSGPREALAKKLGSALCVSSGGNARWDSAGQGAGYDRLAAVGESLRYPRRPGSSVDGGLPNAVARRHAGDDYFA
jgi:hypothetical protein